MYRYNTVYTVYRVKLALRNISHAQNEDLLFLQIWQKWNMFYFCCVKIVRILYIYIYIYIYQHHNLMVNM